MDEEHEKNLENNIYESNKKKSKLSGKITTI